MTNQLKLILEANPGLTKQMNEIIYRRNDRLGQINRYLKELTAEITPLTVDDVKICFAKAVRELFSVEVQF